MKRLFLIFLLAGGPLSSAEAPSPGEGIKYLEAGNYAQALEVFKKGMGPECPFCGLYSGIATFRAGQFAEARKYIDVELALKEKGANPALALGYAFLVQSKWLETAWMEQCLAQMSPAKASSQDDRIFMAQSLLTAGSRAGYPDALKEKAAREVLAQADLLGSTTTGVSNMAGRAWILVAEVAQRKKDLSASTEALSNASKACLAEVKNSPKAVYLQNASVALRLLGDAKQKTFWKLTKLASSNADAVDLAKAVLEQYKQSVDLIEQAQLADGAKNINEYLLKLKKLSLGQKKNFEENESVRKVLAVK